MTLLIATFLACGTPEAVSPPAAEPVPAAPAKGAAAPVPAPETAPVRGSDAERTSKNGKATFTAGDLKATITYGRPSARGRTIFGELVPFGKIWRTGADEATALTLTEDAKVAGQRVEAGTYALFTIPTEKEWVLVLNSVPVQWGAYDHDPSKDVLKAPIQSTKGAPTETLTLTPTATGFDLSWAETVVSIPISPA